MNQRRMDSSGQLARRAVRVLLGAAVAGGLGGCKAHEEDPGPPPSVPPAQLHADADRMIAEGRRIRESGLERRARGQGDGADLIRKGERMISDGEAMKEKAMMWE